MKNNLRSAILFACAAIAIFCAYKVTQSGAKEKPFMRNEGDEAYDFLKWDQKRLADPATGRIPDGIRQKELAFVALLPNDASTPFARLMATTWNMRGPWNVGGRTRAFAADVKNESILLAGTCAGGMWRSTDTGKSWNMVTPLNNNQDVSCLAQDIRTNHTNVWFYGTGECYGASASAGGAYYLGNGLYRSMDNGQTWKVLKATNDNSTTFGSFWQALWNVAVDPSAPDSLSVVYACSIGGVYRSQDTGNTWKTVLGGSVSSYSYYTDVQVSKTGVVYATLSSDGPKKGIWRSTDGINYTNITPPNFPKHYNRVVIGISNTDPNQVYFLANTDSAGMPDTNFLGQVEWDGLWKYKYLSGNGDSAGGAWFDLSNNLPSTGGKFDHYNSQTSYDMVVRFLPGDTSTVFIGGTDIFRSTTGFFDTAHTNHMGGYAVGAALPAVKVYPGHHPDQHVIFFSNSTPYVMYSGCDGGVFKTMNDTAKNVKWTSLDNGYITTMFYTVAMIHEIPGSSVLIGGAQDNNSLFDNSASVSNPWTKPIFGDGSYCAIEDTGKVYYYSSQSGKMFKAQMDTITGSMTAFNRIDPIGGKGYQFVNPYVVDPNNNNLMYLAGGKYLWRNDNLSGIPYANLYDSISTNWVQFTDSVPVPGGANITAVAVSNKPANRVYIGTDQGTVYRIDTANVGSAPKLKDITGHSGSNAFPGSGTYVSSIAVDPKNADSVIVTFSNYNVRNVFFTSNGGTTWTRINGNLGGINGPSIRYSAIMHLPSGGSIFWLATSAGLFAVDTIKASGMVWVGQASNAIGNAVCDMIDIRPSDGLVAIATHSRGIFTANITSLSQIASVRNITVPNAMQVKAYPNPTSGLASVSIYLQEEADVQIKIYDMNGRIVKELPAGHMDNGEHIVSFDGSGLQSGIYFCNVTAGGKQETTRIAIIR